MLTNRLSFSIYFLLCAVYIHILIADQDLYKVLGLSRKATALEIRRAYRQKAKDTHPDKNPGVDPDVASERFRNVADAYEILSDETARRQYDRGGNTRSNMNMNRNQNQRANNDWFWNFHGGFGGNNAESKKQQEQRRKAHPFFFNPHHRSAIKDAQSRTLTITSLIHLEFISSDENYVTDRYTVLAIYDSRIKGCEDHLNMQLLYPYPFAGYSIHTGDKKMESNVWWDAIVLPVKIDLAVNTPESEELRSYFGVSSSHGGSLPLNQCVNMVFINKGDPISQFSKSIVNTHNEFQGFMWQNLKMTVRFVNKTPYTLDLWWLDGLRGQDLGKLEPGEGYIARTFLSHSFFFRAEHVTGHVLTNESALMWYTARDINDDGKEFLIYNKCFDLSGDCPRWKKEGFCDDTSNTPFTRRNPGFRSRAKAKCEVTCEVGCGAPRPKPNHPPTFIHHSNEF